MTRSSMREKRIEKRVREDNMESCSFVLMISDADVLKEWQILSCSIKQGFLLEQGKQARAYLLYT